MIGICTDSNSQLPSSLAERYGIEVVPLTVTIGDHDYPRRCRPRSPTSSTTCSARTRRPVSSTSQPSPGQFAAAYESLLHRGCDEILSIHVTAAMSGTLNAARLATRSAAGAGATGRLGYRQLRGQLLRLGGRRTPWRMARTSTKRAGRRVAGTAHRHGLRRSSELDFIRTGGSAPRHDIDEPDTDSADADRRIPVLTMAGGHISVVSRVATMADAVDSLAAMALGWGPRLKVAVGLGRQICRAAHRGAGRCRRRIGTCDEVVRYRIGPSVGVYTGPGAVGCFMFPAALTGSPRARTAQSSSQLRKL